MKNPVNSNYKWMNHLLVLGIWTAFGIFITESVTAELIQTFFNLYDFNGDKRI